MSELTVDPYDITVKSNGLRRRRIVEKVFGVLAIGSAVVACGILVLVLGTLVVKGWPGLEVNGYAADNTALDIVRFERLAPTVLLCLFEKDGKTLAKLDIHEPAEGLHFGLSGAGSAVNVRYNHQDGAFGPGAQAPGVLQPAPFRSAAGTPRVIRMLRLARALHDPKFATYISGIYAGFDHLPSSQFAMQMLRGVGLVTFKLEGAAQ